MTGEAEMISVVIADDQDLMRGGLKVILESEPGISVTGEARTGAEAVTLVSQLRPDVICLDVQMPDVDGLEAARRIAALDMPTAVLILTTFDRDDYLFEALRAGASGFLLKNASPEKLIEAVRTVAAGDALLAPDVTRRVIERFASGRVAVPDPAVESLTEREREVLGHVAKGRTNAEIARELFLGEATVKTHVSKVLLKLGLRDRIQAVVYAHERGLLG
jgi:DNA-binding NarL/FixJ family response regulator